MGMENILIVLATGEHLILLVQNMYMYYNHSSAMCQREIAFITLGSCILYNNYNIFILVNVISLWYCNIFVCMNSRWALSTHWPQLWPYSERHQSTHQHLVINQRPQSAHFGQDYRTLEEHFNAFQCQQLYTHISWETLPEQYFQN